MSDQLPSPEFDRTKYERPNDAWICGHACEGKPCRLGPSKGGQCQAGNECRPQLEKLPGEEKGRWRCTRPAAHGGPCEDGPRPDGTCCCPIPPCVPHRSLRRVRALFTLVVVTLTTALLVIALGGLWRRQLVNPNTVSRAHQGAAFAELARIQRGSDNTCGACHESPKAGLRSWIHNAFHAKPGPFSRAQFRLMNTGVVAMTPLDRNGCAACHTQHEFHQPNVVEANSCSTCHVEHQGLKMPRPDDANCARCHNEPTVMAASSIRGGSIPAEDFDAPVKPGVRAFRTPRPAGGRTNLITAFWQNHPNFGVLAQGEKDPDTLRFNHAVHLGATVRFNGQPLTCAQCHVPDSTGAYMARISYAQNCAPCHDLQFDPVHPEMRVPHGEVAAVRAKLRGLPLLYAELRANQLIAAGESPAREKTEAFAQENIARMRQTFGSGEQLEKLILFTGDPRERQPGLSAERRAHYAGCAYCHEVVPNRQQLAEIRPTFIPDRWLLNGRFNHAKHALQSCETCHNVSASHSTSDINLPGQSTCAECHRPGGSGGQNCSECHTYHLRAAN
ncbi:MAG TPA: hypothetical protein VMB21_12215 [Candidatus Limnocylindria bacterium]|nr:hypothetical protein [Candidatus Limnocylindria bacterium]